PDPDTSEALSTLSVERMTKPPHLGMVDKDWRGCRSAWPVATYISSHRGGARASLAQRSMGRGRRKGRCLAPHRVGQRRREGSCEIRAADSAQGRSLGPLNVHALLDGEPSGTYDHPLEAHHPGQHLPHHRNGKSQDARLCGADEGDAPRDNSPDAVLSHSL